jgi:succinate-acetate transporter protein
MEYLLGICAVIAMAKVADADGRSGLVWGIITVFIVVGCFFIPLPFLRVLIALIIAFVALMVRKGSSR